MDKLRAVLVEVAAFLHFFLRFSSFLPGSRPLRGCWFLVDELRTAAGRSGSLSPPLPALLLLLARVRTVVRVLVPRG